MRAVQPTQVFEQITYQQEHWVDIHKEILPLAEEHWLEVGLDRNQIPLDLDTDLYQLLDEKGILHVTTARSGKRLVGYFAMCVRVHPHYKTTLCAFLDSYFIASDFRGPYVGIALFEAMEGAMRALGVKKMIAGMKLHKNVDIVFRRLGWEAIETTYGKYIG